MNARRKRRIVSVLVLSGCSILATYAIVQALQENINLFMSPTTLIERNIRNVPVRVGGVVAKGSVQQLEGVSMRFTIADDKRHVVVYYTGVLPDLFKEEQSVVVLGRWTGEHFMAEQVLAKHDENYRPEGKP